MIRWGENLPGTVAMPAAASILPPPLHEGERLTRDEFMRRWEAMPDLKHAELLDGIAHLPSPAGFRHNLVEPRIVSWLVQYADATPGCEVGSDGTWLMSPDAVPQPDASLRIAAGGSSRVENNYLVGAPELAVEVAWSSSARDLGIKSDLYRRHGVREYLVVLAQENDVLWREVVKGRYRKIAPDADGILHSSVFPGLGLDTAALWSEDWPRLRASLDAGLATPGHAAFARRLRAARK